MKDRFFPAFALLLALQGTALAQGNDTSTSTMAPQGSPRPTALSQATVSAVSGGKPVAPRSVPLARPAERGGPLDLPGSVRLAAPARLACADIAERTARSRCENLRTMPAPPRGTPPDEAAP